jgi:hypothetical protein
MKIKLFEDWIFENNKKNPEDKSLYKGIKTFLNKIEYQTSADISNKANIIFNEFDKLNKKQKYDAHQALKTIAYLNDVDLLINPYYCALDLGYYSELPSYSYTEENKPDLSQLPIDTVKFCVRWFVHSGLSLEGACAMVGNLWRESYLNPYQKQIETGPGRGLAQWTLGDRWDTYMNTFFSKFKASHSSLRYMNPYHIEPQLAFVMYELKTTYRGVYNTLISSGDIEGKTIKVLKIYEAPRDKDKLEEHNVRVGLAKKVYQVALSDNKIPAIFNIVAILKNFDRRLFS